MDETTLPPPAGHAADTTDRRLVRGARTRQLIARHAADAASLEGLNGLSIGRLATDLDLSKSGVQTLFTTKENLQVATAEAARTIFVSEVVGPARSAPHGTARLRALVDSWLAYVERPVFPGGCFWGATIADFDSRPGAVHDTLVAHRREWRDLLAAELRRAVEADEIADLDIDLAAFQIDAILAATNIALRLGEEDAVDRARRAVDRVLAV